VQMPVMDGVEATRRIRDPHSAVRNHDIPIIAMTANAMQSDRTECLDAGMNDYVSKPVSRQALAEALVRWLPKEAAAATERAPVPAGAVSVSAEEPEESVFDKIGFLDRVMDDEEFARMLMEGFLDDIPKQMRALKEFIGSGDVTGAARQAHTIKGAAANMGGETLRAAAFEVEESLKSGSLGTASAHIPELERQFARLKEAMGLYINQARREDHGHDVVTTVKSAPTHARKGLS
jgi:HPt (histidine-containing phosphotransfer) domain-containing protein